MRRRHNQVWLARFAAVVLDGVQLIVLVLPLVFGILMLVYLHYEAATEDFGELTRTAMGALSGTVVAAWMWSRNFDFFDRITKSSGSALRLTAAGAAGTGVLLALSIVMPARPLIAAMVALALGTILNFRRATAAQIDLSYGITLVVLVWGAVTGFDLR
jgi:hypothetical protein